MPIYLMDDRQIHILRQRRAFRDSHFLNLCYLSDNTIYNQPVAGLNNRNVYNVSNVTFHEVECHHFLSIYHQHFILNKRILDTLHNFMRVINGLHFVGNSFSFLLVFFMKNVVTHFIFSYQSHNCDNDRNTILHDLICEKNQKQKHNLKLLLKIKQISPKIRNPITQYNDFKFTKWRT